MNYFQIKKNRMCFYFWFRIKSNEGVHNFVQEFICVLNRLSLKCFFFSLNTNSSDKNIWFNHRYSINHTRQWQLRVFIANKTENWIVKTRKQITFPFVWALSHGPTWILDNNMCSDIRLSLSSILSFALRYKSFDVSNKWREVLILLNLLLKYSWETDVEKGGKNSSIVAKKNKQNLIFNEIWILKLTVALTNT